MKTIEINIYEFSELSEKAKEKAIQNWNKNSDYNYHLKKDAQCYLEDINRYEEIEDIYFEISYSQSDYFTFEFSYLNEDYLHDIINALPLRNWEKNLLKTFSYKIHFYSSGRYSKNIVLGCDNVSYLYYPNIYNFVENWLEEIESIISDNYKDDCNDIYKNLRNDLEEYESEEHFKDLCEMNNYYFYEDGTMH